MTLSLLAAPLRCALHALPICAALLALTARAGAQQPVAPGQSRPAKYSFSNAHDLKQIKQGAQPFADVASEQARADAIAAQCLHDLYMMANDEHFHHGEYNHAINLNQVVMEGDPSNVETYTNNAYLLWSTDREPLAMAVLKKGLAANPDTYYMYDEVGVHYLMQEKDPKSALPYLEKAVKFHDCPMVTFHSLAHCYERLGQWAQAVKTWETATRFPYDKVAIVRLKRAQAQLDKQPGNGK